VGVLLACIQAGSATLLSRADLWLMPVTPSVAVILSAAAAGAWESRRVQGLVARLVPARITRVMERAGGFGVEEGTVLLSDIRGYSRFSEHLDPATVMALLNDYFSRMHDILDRHNGHFVKSPGDCLVAWFSEEPRTTHHSERALRAALEIIAHADEFGKRWSAFGAEPFVVGVGVNSGPMAVGVLDARRHIEPTVIGDAVNVAARLEGLTHAESAPILATEETIGPVRDRFDCHFVGELKLGGRARPARIYRVDGLTAKSEDRSNARRGAT
jgi:class 3 adenylate cyclase